MSGLVERCPKCDRTGGDCGEHLPEWEDLCAYWKGTAEAAQARIAELEAQLAGAREALTPSGDTKAAYHGEFAFSEERYDPESGDYYNEKVYVPWTTVKEIMAAIAARANLKGPTA